MKLALKTFEHNSKEFSVKVKEAGKKVVKAVNTNSQEDVCFNRQKFEFMVKKGVFKEVQE